jgi:hypothetical protein
MVHGSLVGRQTLLRIMEKCPARLSESLNNAMPRYLEIFLYKLKNSVSSVEFFGSKYLYLRKRRNNPDTEGTNTCVNNASSFITTPPTKVL